MRTRLIETVRRHGDLWGDGGRFILAGGANTLLSLLVYQLLLFWLSRVWAWTIAWVGCLLLFSVIYPKLVFKRGRLTARRVLLNIIYYLCSYGLSLWLLTLFVSGGVNERWAAFLVLMVTVPTNFIFSRLIFSHRAGNKF